VEVAALFSSGGFTPYSVYSNALDAIRDLTHRAHFKFQTKVIEAAYGNQLPILNEVLADMVHDAKLAEKQLLNQILNDILQPSVESNVIVPCGELVQPVQDMIDAIPVPGLRYYDYFLYFFVKNVFLSFCLIIVCAMCCSQ
jgi:hypothetical protein